MRLKKRSNMRYTKCRLGFRIPKSEAARAGKKSCKKGSKLNCFDRIWRPRVASIDLLHELVESGSLTSVAAHLGLPRAEIDRALHRPGYSQKRAIGRLSERIKDGRLQLLFRALK